jgi:FHA domain-containing protein
MKETPQEMDRQQMETPWLEYYPDGGGTIHRVTLEEESLTIGRAETAEVQIDSTRVSREHARIEICDGKTMLRDLGSTNGTLVNGREVQEIELRAGDIILVADTELTYQTSATNRLRSMATQKLPQLSDGPRQVGETHSPWQDASDAILAVRKAHESLMQQYVPIGLETILELPEGVPYAHLAAPARCQSPPDEHDSLYLQPPTHVQLRLRGAQRQAAIRQAQSTDIQISRFVVPLEPWEIHEGAELLWHLVSLELQLPSEGKLLASIRASDAVDLPDVEQFCHDLREQDIGVACHGFMGSHAHVHELKEVRPELLLLAPELMSEPLENRRQQRRLSAVLEACEELQIIPVVQRPSSDELVRIWMEHGFRLFTEPAAAGDSHGLTVGHQESCEEVIAIG